MDEDITHDAKFPVVKHHLLCIAQTRTTNSRQTVIGEA